MAAVQIFCERTRLCWIASSDRFIIMIRMFVMSNISTSVNGTYMLAMRNIEMLALEDSITAAYESLPTFLLWPLSSNGR